MGLSVVRQRRKLAAGPAARSTALAIAAICITSLATAVLATGLARASTPSSPRVFASFIAVGSKVDASGTVGAGAVRGTGPRSSWRVSLEQQVRAGGHKRWLARRSAPLHSTDFRLSWNAPQTAPSVIVRVAVISGHVTVASSPARRVRVHPSIVVNSKLRAGTVRVGASRVLGISTATGGATTVVLARGVQAPRVGGVLVVPVSPPAPRGVLGIVTTLDDEHNGSTRVTTRPATLQDAYSAFDLKVDGTLGDLLGEAAHASVTSYYPRAHSAGLIPSFHCNGSTAPISADVDLSQLHVLLDVNASVYSPSIQFILEGRPTFTLNYGVSAAVNCTASLNGPPIPLGDTGLFLTMGPEFSFSAGGALSAHMTWSPFIGITFFRSLRSGNSDSHTFRNGGSTSFTGSATASLSLGLQTSVSLGEGDAELAAISGTIGPVITAGVQAAQAQTCFDVNASAEADLSASAHVLFNNWEYDIGNATFGNLPLYHHCVSSGGGGGGGGPVGGGPGGIGPGGGGPSGPEVTTSSSLIAMSQDHTCSVLSNGEVACWGSNYEGELGRGVFGGMSDVALRVNGITNARAVTAGENDTGDFLVTGYTCAFAR